MELLILHNISRQPMHGYMIMKLIEDKLGYTVSPGTLYPLLRSMVRKGYLEARIRKKGGKVVKTYYLTEAGQRYLEENREQVERVLRFVEGLKEFREAGGEELRKFLEELVVKMPQVDRETRKQIAVMLKKCLAEFRRLLGWS